MGMWKTKKQVTLTEESQKEIGDFYKMSDRYVRLLCFKYQMPPKITQDDIYGQAYEKLCVYAASHKLNRPGYQRLAQLLVQSARQELLMHNYQKLVIPMYDRENIESGELSLLESTIPSHNLYMDEVDEEHNREQVKRLFSSLKDCERKFMEEYYIMENSTPEIAKKYGVTRQYVNYVILTGYDKLKKLFK